MVICDLVCLSVCLLSITKAAVLPTFKMAQARFVSSAQCRRFSAISFPPLNYGPRLIKLSHLRGGEGDRWQAAHELTSSTVARVINSAYGETTSWDYRLIRQGTSISWQFHRDLWHGVDREGVGLLGWPLVFFFIICEPCLVFCTFTQCDLLYLKTCFFFVILT